MQNIMKRALCLVVIATILLSCIVPTSFAAITATTPTGYTSASDVDYVTNGGYVANWGARGEDATFLSKYAEAFYTGTNTYDNFITYSGGSTQSNASSSTLYSKLKSFMTSKHSYQTSYDATKSLYKYTDCVYGNYSNISSFYSGTVLSGSWGSGWNREHSWPNSKGLGGNDENDIMMLRPTSTSENSSRGNTAYGEGSGYYNPNSESGGKFNLHGDCARIVLYVYVRWGNTSYMWGASGVMESLDVLLKWMEEDPVDTWEMGRNDAVQSITGTRNVFVDYPELAWKLFGREIPDDMVTPSGEAKGGSAPLDPSCQHTNTQLQGASSASCETTGHTGNVVCLSCGGIVTKGTVIEALGHNWQPTSGDKEECTRCHAERTTAQLVTKLNNGDKVVIAAPTFGKLLSMTKIATHYNAGVDYVNDDFSVASNNEIFTVKVNSDGSYTFTSLSGKVLAASTGYNSLDETSAQNKWTLQAVSGKTGVYYVKNTSQTKYLEWYAEKGNWSVYSDPKDAQFEVSFYLIEAATVCTHSTTEIRGASSATCTTNGYSGDTYCKSCGAKVATGTTITSPGHNYLPTQDGGEECTRCGDVIPPSQGGSGGFPGEDDNTDQPGGNQGGGQGTNPPSGDDNTDQPGGNQGGGQGTNPPLGDDNTDTPSDDDNTGSDNPPAPGTCTHANTEKRNIKEATCSESGYSGDSYCADCGAFIKMGTATFPVDHKYETVDGKTTCTMCGEEGEGGLSPEAQTGITIGAVSVGGVSVIAVILFLIFKRKPI